MGYTGRRRRSRLWLALPLLVVLAWVAIAAWRTGPAPEIAIEPELPGIGRRTPVRIALSEPRRGLSGVTVELVQGDRVEPIATRAHEPLGPFRFWGERVENDELTVEVGSETIKGLKEGPATLRVTAARAPSLLRRPGPSVAEITLPVRLRPPALQLLSRQTYVSQGGCEAVVYQVGETSTADGVQAGEWWFPGHPLPGGAPLQRFALFSAPYDLTDPTQIRLVARDEVGNEARSAFVERFSAQPLRRDTIDLNLALLERLVTGILSQTPELEDRGDLLANYLQINGDLRAANAKTLVELAGQSSPAFAWSEGFVSPLRGGKVTSSFADRRTYVLEGKAVDQQDHLGFDLASTRMAEVLASNAGTVVLARYFGIYGNAVVIDHGYGLMTLYGHLSSIGVTQGQQVARGEVVGRSGETGLAGGDHLHFTVLLQGLAVDPREWWDDHWLHDRLKLKLGAALPFRG